MPAKLSRLAKELVGVTLWEGVKFAISGLLATSVFAWFASLATKFVPILQANALFVYPVVVFSGLLVLLLLYERFSRYRAKMPTQDFEFLVLDKSVTYEYHDLTHMTYKKTYKLKARRRGLQAFPDRFSWTGTGPVTVKSARWDHIFVKTERSNVWQYYEVRFNRTLSKGEEVDVEIVWTLEDVGHTAVPFLSADVVEPTDKLSLTVVLPHSLGVQEVTAEASAGAKRPYDSMQLKLDGAGRAEWNIPDPQLFHHFMNCDGFRFSNTNIASNAYTTTSSVRYAKQVCPRDSPAALSRSLGVGV